jgi:hypothetical protein
MENQPATRLVECEPIVRLRRLTLASCNPKSHMLLNNSSFFSLPVFCVSMRACYHYRQGRQCVVISFCKIAERFCFARVFACIRKRSEPHPIGCGPSQTALMRVMTPVDASGRTCDLLQGSLQLQQSLLFCPSPRRGCCSCGFVPDLASRPSGNFPHNSLLSYLCVQASFLLVALPYQIERLRTCATIDRRLSLLLRSFCSPGCFDCSTLKPCSSMQFALAIAF